MTVTEGRTFELRYVAGPEGVAVGGALTFVPEPFWGWSPPQTHAPAAPGFVDVQAPPGVQLVARAHQGQLVLEVAERPLEPGSTVRLIYSGRGKDDRLDAERLARLGRVDPKLLHPIRHREGSAQADRAVIRSRDVLVGCRTKLINHARGIVKSMGGTFADL